MKTHFIDMENNSQRAHACMLYRSTIVVNASFSEVMNAIASCKTDEYRKQMRGLYGSDFVDGVCLHKLPQTKQNRPAYFYTALKWCVLQPPSKVNGLGSDFCFLEYAGIHKETEVNEKMGFCIQQSVSMDSEVPDFAHYGLQRDTFQRTGLLVTATGREHTVRLTSFCQIQNARLQPAHPRDLELMMFRRVAAVRDFAMYLERGRLGKMQFVERWRWIPDTDRRTCAVCLKMFLDDHCGSSVFTVNVDPSVVEFLQSPPHKGGREHDDDNDDDEAFDRQDSDDEDETRLVQATTPTFAPTPSNINNMLASTPRPVLEFDDDDDADSDFVPVVLPPPPERRTSSNMRPPPPFPQPNNSHPQSNNHRLLTFPHPQHTLSAYRPQQPPQLAQFPYPSSFNQASDMESTVSFQTNATDDTECPYATQNYGKLMHEFDQPPPPQQPPHSPHPHNNNSVDHAFGTNLSSNRSNPPLPTRRPPPVDNLSNFTLQLQPQTQTTPRPNSTSMEPPPTHDDKDSNDDDDIVVLHASLAFARLNQRPTSTTGPNKAIDLALDFLTVDIPLLPDRLHVLRSLELLLTAILDEHPDCLRIDDRSSYRPLVAAYPSVQHVLRAVGYTSSSATSLVLSLDQVDQSVVSHALASVKRRNRGP
ncbi:hypothetical protein DYB31_004330 [Aphanomyces astaci]|uniref:Uncharacterized protein n=3 Tax=Aphanomyces astaci TaxID=112090 RepID=A0A397FGS4_APHAT|nr:hypothetical protein DYB31_004330 [Aphanomyces astaci]